MPLPKVDEFVQIDPQLCRELNAIGSNLENGKSSLLSRSWWVTIGVLGGGSCFLHAILWCIYKPYRDLTIDKRFRRSSNFASNWPPTSPKQSTKRSTMGISKVLATMLGSVYSYKSLREGLSDYTHWFGLEFLTFVQDQLNVNIHILSIDKGMLQFYRFAPDSEITFHPNRNNILLFWEGRNHFQPSEGFARQAGSQLCFQK